jgi:hypothetical protein
MRRIVLVIELLVELLMLEMIIKVVKEALILGWIMGKGRSSRRTEDECSRNGQRSSHVRFLGRDAFGARYRFHDTLPSTPQLGVRSQREFPAPHSRTAPADGGRIKDV